MMLGLPANCSSCEQLVVDSSTGWYLPRLAHVTFEDFMVLRRDVLQEIKRTYGYRSGVGCLLFSMHACMYLSV